MGGLIAALRASGTDADEITAMARWFRLSGRFLPGRMLVWDRIFASAVPLPRDKTFGDLVVPLAVSAVDHITADATLHTDTVCRMTVSTTRARAA